MDLSRTEAVAARGFAAATVLVLVLVNVRWGIWFGESLVASGHGAVNLKYT